MHGMHAQLRHLHLPLPSSSDSGPEDATSLHQHACCNTGLPTMGCQQALRSIVPAAAKKLAHPSYRAGLFHTSRINSRRLMDSVTAESIRHYRWREASMRQDQAWGG